MLITPHDYPWLKAGRVFRGQRGHLRAAYRRPGFRSFASTRELIRALQNSSLDFGLDIRVTIHGRFVKPILDITLLFLGLPLVVSRQSRNVFWAIGLCLAIVTLFSAGGDGAGRNGEGRLLDYARAGRLGPLDPLVPPAVALGESMWER